MKIIKYTVTENDDGKEIKSILKNTIMLSSAIIKRLKYSDDGILLCNEKAKVTEHVKLGDILTLKLTDEKSPNIEPVNIPIKILHEDDDILCVCKPRSMPTHPSQNHHDDTLANGIMYYYRENPFTFRVITRLDKDTSGVVLIAKNAFSAHLLSKQMRNGEIQKEYLAVCHGIFENKCGTINVPIGRSENSTIKRCIDENGKEAVTNYEVIFENDNISIVKLIPCTGRTHQLRLHLSYIGHPIYGDDLYGSYIKNKETLLQCLSISFIHPQHGTKIKIKCNIADDIKKFFN